MRLHPVRGNEQTRICLSFQEGFKVLFPSDENGLASIQLWPAGWVGYIVSASIEASHQCGQHGPALQLHRAAQAESGGVFCNKDLYGN